MKLAWLPILVLPLFCTTGSDRARCKRGQELSRRSRFSLFPGGARGPVPFFQWAPGASQSLSPPALTDVARFFYDGRPTGWPWRAE